MRESNDVAAAWNEYTTVDPEVTQLARDLEREWDEAYARLPQVLRDKDRDGYAAEKEVDRAVAELFLKDEGLEGKGSNKVVRHRSALSNSEYLQLVAARKKFPKMSVLPVEHGDGEMGLSFTFSRAGIDVAAFEPFAKEEKGDVVDKVMDELFKDHGSSLLSYFENQETFWIMRGQSGKGRTTYHFVPKTVVDSGHVVLIDWPSFDVEE